MLHRNVLIPLLFAFAFPASSIAEFYDGNKLKELLVDWDSQDAKYGGAIGLGFVVGVHDTWDGIFVCSPRIQVKQTGSVVLNYLRANPDKLHQSASSLALAALSKAWPCQQKPSGQVDSTPAPSPAPKPKPKPKEEASPF